MGEGINAADVNRFSDFFISDGVFGKINDFAVHVGFFRKNERGVFSEAFERIFGLIFEVKNEARRRICVKIRF